MEKNDQTLPSTGQKYLDYEKNSNKSRPIFKNCLKAFIIGGLICTLGQLMMLFFIYFFDFTEKTASNPVVATLIFITMLLTGFGLYEPLGQYSGAGTNVPVTGFGNAVISAAIEHRSEGFILGVGTNMLKIAGPVIVYGVFSAFIIGLIKTLLIKGGVL